MDSQEIIKELKANASEKYKENVIRMGIPAENSIGVATSVVRSFAKKSENRKSWHLNCGIQNTTRQGCWLFC